MVQQILIHNHFTTIEEEFSSEGQKKRKKDISSHGCCFVRHLRANIKGGEHHTLYVECTSYGL